jgi:hypothetical protein
MSKELKCLCCGEPVDPKDVKLHYRVFICNICGSTADAFTSEVLGDLRRLQASIVQIIRHGLISGAMQHAERSSVSPVSRVRFLLALSAELESECQQLKKSSGETTRPSALADGKRSSSSTDLPD